MKQLIGGVVLCISHADDVLGGELPCFLRWEPQQLKVTCKLVPVMSGNLFDFFSASKFQVRWSGMEKSCQVIRRLSVQSSARARDPAC